MKIVCVTTNNPIFIELQYQTIQKYFRCESPVEFIIFNDAKSFPDITNFNDVTMPDQIRLMCGRLDIKCIDIPNSHHAHSREPSVRHSQSVNFITKYMLSNPDTYLMLDCDMFFVETFHCKEFENYYFCYINQTRQIQHQEIAYPWPNFFYIDITRIPNSHLLDWSVEPGLDAGGKCREWVATLDQTKVLKIKHLCSCGWDITQLPANIDKNLTLFLDTDSRNVNGKYFAEIYHDKILHYRAASNWMNQSAVLHKYLIEMLKMALDSMK